MANQHTVQDPREQYSQGKIPEQTQPEPGLDTELKPHAVHGVDTYEGASRLEGRKALVSGGDSGIGRAVVLAYAREGAEVVFSHLSNEQADVNEFLDMLGDARPRVHPIAVDFTDEAAVRQMVRDAIEQLGGLDIVVNNAGKQIYNDDIATLPTKQLVDTFTVNVFAMFWIVQEAMRHLKPGASIINTTSIQATQPSPGLIDYAATKAAITNFTRGLAQQLTPKGIRVNAVAPGPIWTPLQPSYGQPQEKIVEFGNDTPLGRPGQPIELAPLYVFLASQESSYVSGEVIGATGGKLR